MKPGSCLAIFISVVSAPQAVLWRYKFSQLKGSSDDGKSKIKFLFQNQDSKSIEAKVIPFERTFTLPSRGNAYSTGPFFFFIMSFRSWSSQTSSPCFIVFTLFSPPKSLAWTRFSWRAKATRPPPASRPSAASRVTHRRRSWNTPPDRRFVTMSSRGLFDSREHDARHKEDSKCAILLCF